MFLIVFSLFTPLSIWVNNCVYMGHISSFFFFWSKADIGDKHYICRHFIVAFYFIFSLLFCLSPETCGFILMINICWYFSCLYLLCFKIYFTLNSRQNTLKVSSFQGTTDITLEIQVMNNTFLWSLVFLKLNM